VSDFSLGRAEGEIALKYNPAGAAAAKKDIDQVESKSRKSSGSVDKVGKSAGIAGGLIAAGFALAVNSAANFQARLSAIQAVSGATGSQMNLVSKKALQLGKDTKFSASEAAQAIEELVKAGISLPDVLNGAADATVALAAAGEIDLPRAAEIAANAMNVFNLKARDMPKVADLIAGAANASAIDVEQFAQSLQQSGAAANLAGLSFADLATGIALMGNAGIKGSDAGTSLKTMLLNLNPTTKKQINLMKELGIITKKGANNFFDARGKAKSLADISQVLSNALKGMSQQQKLATLDILFGSDAIRASAVLAKAGAAGFNTMTKAMTKVKAADVAATRMNNLKGQIEQMRGSIETVAIIIGTQLIPRITAMTKRLTEWANAFANLSPQTQHLILTILQVTSAVLIFMFAVIRIVRFITLFAEAMRTIAALRGVAAVLKAIGVAVKFLNAALLTNPVFLVVAALVLLGVALFLAYKRSQTFRNIVQEVFKWLKDNVLPIVFAVWRGLVAAFIAIVAAAKSFSKSLIGAWNAAFAFLAPIVRTVFTVISTIIKVYIAIWTAIIKAGIAAIVFVFHVFQSIWPIISAVFGLIVALFKLEFAIIKLIVTVWILVIVSIIRAGMFAIRAIFSVVWAVITAIVRAAIAVVRAVVSAGMAVIRAVVSGAVAAIRAVWNAFWNSFLGAAVRRGVSLVISGVQSLVRIVGMVAGFMGRFVAAVATGFGRAVAAVARGAADILSPILGLADKFFHAGVEMIAALIRGITSMIDKVRGAISRVTGIIGKAIPGSPVEEGPLRVLNKGHAGKQIVRMIIDGVVSQRDNLRKTMRDVSLVVPETVLGVPAAVAASASRTASLGGSNGTSPALAQDALAAALADAVTEGLTNARFIIGADGIARIVTKKIATTLQTGARA
jgi:TP901 family phage tail tape measure protein